MLICGAVSFVKLSHDEVGGHDGAAEHHGRRESNAGYACIPIWLVTLVDQFRADDGVVGRETEVEVVRVAVETERPKNRARLFAFWEARSKRHERICVVIIDDVYDFETESVAGQKSGVGYEERSASLRLVFDVMPVLVKLSERVEGKLVLEEPISGRKNELALLQAQDVLARPRRNFRFGFDELENGSEPSPIDAHGLQVVGEPAIKSFGVEAQDGRAGAGRKKTRRRDDRQAEDSKVV